MTEKELEFQKIHNDFRPKIYRYLRRLAGEHAAEDLTQDVFVNVSHALSSFRGDSRLSTWIYKIATHAAIDHLRSSSSRRVMQEGSSHDPTVQFELAVEGNPPWTGETAPPPDALLVRKEMNECIRQFIEDLPIDHRTALVLSEIEGLRNSEIAEVLGITLETVKIRLHRARARLRKELETHCRLYHDEHNELACDLKAAFVELRTEK